MFCNKCGKEINNDDTYCGNCGAEIKNTETDSNKKKEKKKLKEWQKVIIIIIVIIASMGIIANIVNYTDQQNIKRNAEKWELEHYGETKNTISKNQSNLTKNEVSSYNSLIGKHNIIYIDGMSLSGIIGYLDLKSDNTFKMYVNYTPTNMEISNLEGTYKIYGDKITLNIIREGGYDLGSQKREETLTIAQDNLAYFNMKFAR